MRLRTVACWALAVPAVALLLLLDPLGDVLGALDQVDPLLVIAAAGLELASCLSYVVVFRRIFEPVTSGSAARVGWLGLGAGAVLPGGNVAGVAASCFLLHRDGVPKRRLIVPSGVLLLLINGVGSAVTGLAAGLMLIGAAPGPHDLLRTGVPIVVSAGIAGVVVALPFAVCRFGRRAPRWMVASADSVTAAGRLLRDPDWRLAGAAGYPLLDTAALWAACVATGHAPSPAALIVAYNIGYLASVVPIPAGIGVLDGGLAAALVIYGASPAAAVVAVLIYHALAVWIPGLCGLGAWVPLGRGQRVARAQAVATRVSSSPPLS